MHNHDYWSVCLHEAGHVITGINLGIPVFQSVAYRSRKKDRPLGMTQNYSDYYVSEVEHAAYCLGGFVACNLYAGEDMPKWWPEASDFSDAMRDGPETYLRGEAFARDMLSDQRQVERVATVLRDHTGWVKADRLQEALKG